jgi:Domain of unknown function (DUF4852)/Bacterial SH3 domain
MRITRIVALFLTMAIPCAMYAQKDSKGTAEIIVENANLRESPNATSNVIREVALGERFVLIDSQPVGAWYSVIDRKTKKEGWLHGNTFKVMTARSLQQSEVQRRQSASPVPPPISDEKAFYRGVAIDGIVNDSAVDYYGRVFDTMNYQRAMADEFERNRYRARIRALIANEVKKVDFNEKFTFSQVVKLGDYSFGSHTFPFVSFPGYANSVFTIRASVNAIDFDWSVPVSETDANAFVKSRSNGTGSVNRNVIIRITYSLVNSPEQRKVGGFFIYKFEIFSDDAMTKRLSVVTKNNSQGPSTVEEWRSAAVAAQTSTKEIGKYRYIASWQSSFMQKSFVFGEITLTDIGHSLSGDASSKPSTFGFFGMSPSRDYGQQGIDNQILYARPIQDAGTLWRVSGDGMGAKDLRVKWETSKTWAGRMNFETEQERDRFFVDFANAIQAWKTKYAAFDFAAGKVNIDQRCENNTGMKPC